MLFRSDFHIADVGSPVYFSEEEGDEGPQASAVQLVHPHSHAARRGNVS